MYASLTSGLLCALTLGISPWVPANRPDELPPKMTLQVYNYAQVPARTLDEAKAETLRIFEKGGIDLLWLDMGSTDPIVFPSRGSEIHLTVVIYNHAPYRTASRHTMGAMMKDAMAGVFYDRVVSMAGGFSTNRSILLAHVIAHELGHVLLLSHSSKGIMRPRWRSRDFRRAESGNLLFTPDESRRIRTALTQR